MSNYQAEILWQRRDGDDGRHVPAAEPVNEPLSGRPRLLGFGRPRYFGRANAHLLGQRRLGEERPAHAAVELLVERPELRRDAEVRDQQAGAALGVRIGVREPRHVEHGDAGKLEHRILVGDHLVFLVQRRAARTQGPGRVRSLFFADRAVGEDHLFERVACAVATDRGRRRDHAVLPHAGGEAGGETIAEVLVGLDLVGELNLSAVIRDLNVTLGPHRLGGAVVDHLVSLQRPRANANLDIARGGDDAGVAVFLELIRFQNDFVVLRHRLGRCGRLDRLA